MKSFVKWCVALAAIGGLVFFSGAWTAQDGSKKPAPPPAPANPQGKPQTGDPVAKAKSERLDALKKAMPTLKLPLSEAIALAEKEMKGKAHGADIELLKDGKIQIEVRLLVGDRFEKVYVDHETRKVTPSSGKDDDDDDDGHEHEGHHDGH
jgi:hypothetical protein